MVDYLSSQLDWVGYQVSTKWGSGPGDITYLPCKGGKNMYLATVIDTYSRKLAGYALADHMRVSLVIDALAHAHGVRGSLDGAI